MFYMQGNCFIKKKILLPYFLQKILTYLTVVSNYCFDSIYTLFDVRYIRHLLSLKMQKTYIFLKT